MADYTTEIRKWIRENSDKYSVKYRGKKPKPWVRQRYARFRVKYTGEVFNMDLKKKRLEHLQERIFTWASIAEENLKGVRMVVYQVSYDTLGTLVDANDWHEGDIRDFMRAFKQRVGSRLLAYAWVAELHEFPKTMHYHIAIYAEGFLPIPDIDYEWQGRKYKRLWTHGTSHVNWKPKGAYYLGQYVGKEKQKDFMSFPKNARGVAVWFADKKLKEKLRKNLVGNKLVRKNEGFVDIEFLGTGMKKEYLDNLFPEELEVDFLKDAVITESL